MEGYCKNQTTIMSKYDFHKMILVEREKTIRKFINGEIILNDLKPSVSKKQKQINKITKKLKDF